MKSFIRFAIGFIIILIGAALLPVVAIKFGTSGLIIGIFLFVLLVLGVIFLSFKSALSNFPFDDMTSKTEDIPNGIVVAATITNFQQSGVNMSMGTLKYFEMLIDVNVHDIDGTIWPARIKQMVPLGQLNMFQICAAISVKYDPNDKSKVILTTEMPGSSKVSSVDIPGYGTANSQTAQSAVQNAPADITLRLRANTILAEELKASGVATSAIVLSRVLIYGNYMNGADVYQLKLRVNAKNIPHFETEIVALMSKAALYKIEEGKTVYVKYDPNNPYRLFMTGTDKPDTSTLL